MHSCAQRSKNIDNLLPSSNLVSEVRVFNHRSEVPDILPDPTAIYYDLPVVK